MAPRRRILHALGAVASVALALSACGDGSDEAIPAGAAADAGGAATAVAPAAGAIGTATGDLLAFRAPLVGGGTFDGAELAGTPVVLWFWAPG